MDESTIESLVTKALEGQKLATARLISIFEDSRADANIRRRAVLQAFDRHRTRRAKFIGITGTPGAGKSSLCGELALRLSASDPRLRIAVLAIDPSSHISGGALLGDRTRVRFPINDPRLYFRSQASDLELGGVSRTTFPVCRVLDRLFDYVFVETVGVGQSEIEIQQVADFVFLVLTPLGGDQVQFMKAGIMEVPDAIILNKCDAVEEARRSYHALRGSLSLARPDDEERVRIFQTSVTANIGLDDVTQFILSLERDPIGRSMVRKERYFFEKWARDEFGRIGLRFLAAQGGPNTFLEKEDFETAQVSFRALVSESLGEWMKS